MKKRCNVKLISSASFLPLLKLLNVSNNKNMHTKNIATRKQQFNKFLMDTPSGCNEMNEMDRTYYDTSGYTQF